MRYIKYLMDAKMMERTMIGLSIYKKPLTRLRKQIKSILDENNVDYEEVKDLHVTIAQIPGKYRKDELKRKMDEIAKRTSFKIRKVEPLWGQNVKKHFITLELAPNDVFIEMHNKVKEEFDIIIFPTLKPHVSLFIVNEKLQADVQNKLHQLTSGVRVTVSGITLFNNKFSIEFSQKVMKK